MDDKKLVESENPDSESKDDKMKIIACPMKFEEHLEIFGLLLDIHNNKIPPNVKIRKYDENTSIIIRDKTITRKRSDSCKITKSHSIDKYDNNKNKLVFWLSDNNYHVENKIQEELLTLLKQIFDKRYQIYPNNVCSLSKYSTHIKNKVGMYCNEDYSMSKYILYLLYYKFSDLFEYIDKKVDIEAMKLEDFRSLKEILYHLGNDLKIIFADAVDTLCRVADFTFSNILMILFNEYLDKVNKLKEPLLIQVALTEEKNSYLHYINGIVHLDYTKNIENWVEDIIDINTEQNNNSEEKINNDKINNQNEINKNSNNIGLVNMTKENNIKDVHKLNIEDLVSYINEPKPKTNNKKKTKKKKKAKKENKENKEKENNNKENKNENTSIEEDLIFDDFKKCIEESYSKNHFLYPKKIEPKISDSFLKQLEIYYE